MRINSSIYKDIRINLFIYHGKIRSTLIRYRGIEIIEYCFRFYAKVTRYTPQFYNTYTETNADICRYMYAIYILGKKVPLYITNASVLLYWQRITVNNVK